MSLFGFIIMAFFFFVTKTSRSGHFASENNFVLGYLWKLHVFSPPALVFNLVGFERKGAGSQLPSAWAAVDFQTWKGQNVLAPTLSYG